MPHEWQQVVARIRVLWPSAPQWRTPTLECYFAELREHPASDVAEAVQSWHRDGRAAPPHSGQIRRRIAELREARGEPKAAALPEPDRTPMTLLQWEQAQVDELIAFADRVAMPSDRLERRLSELRGSWQGPFSQRAAAVLDGSDTRSAEQWWRETFVARHGAHSGAQRLADVIAPAPPPPLPLPNPDPEFVRALVDEYERGEITADEMRQLGDETRSAAREEIAQRMRERKAS